MRADKSVIKVLHNLQVKQVALEMNDKHIDESNKMLSSDFNNLKQQIEMLRQQMALLSSELRIQNARNSSE